MLPESTDRPGQSEDILELLKALSCAKQKIGAMDVKGKLDIRGKVSKFAKFNDIINAIREPFIEFNLIITYNEIFKDGNTFLISMLTHFTSGQWISSKKIFPLSWGTEYAINLTNHKKYSTCNLVGLYIDEDEDSSKTNYYSKETQTEQKTYPISTSTELITDKQFHYINRQLAGKEKLKEVILKKLNILDLREMMKKEFNEMLNIAKEVNY